MKKNILILLVAFFGFSNVVFSAACETQSGNSTIIAGAGYANSCSAEPDYYEVKIYEMGLCSSAPTAPTTSSKIDTTSCQTVMTSTSGSSISVVKGTTTSIPGTINRPVNGTYTHGYIRISNDFVLKDSRQYSISLSDGTNPGDHCATTSSGMACDTSAVTAAKRTFSLQDFGNNDSYTMSKSTSDGTVNAYLVVDSTEYLAESDGVTKYLVGVQTLNTPLIISDSTSKMNSSFETTTGMSIFKTSGGANPTFSVVNGPFSLRMTVE